MLPGPHKHFPKCFPSGKPENRLDRIAPGYPFCIDVARPLSYDGASMPLVLVVDDDESTGDAIRRLLGRMGYTAQWAPGGHEAIAALQVEKPDLVVLDWMMPGMNGLEVLRRLRANPATQLLPVIIYTAASSPAVAQLAADHGAQDCVLKSGGFFPLYDSIQRHVAH